LSKISRINQTQKRRRLCQRVKSLGHIKTMYVKEQVTNKYSAFYITFESSLS